MNPPRSNAICIYCGSSPGLLPEYAEAAVHVGRTLARRGITLVYGGAHVGLMGMMADAALEAGGRVIGVMPHLLIGKEVVHPGLTELHAVESMHQRKTLMADLSDGFIALPGGVGTLEEIFEVYTWTQIGFHTKPCAFLNVADFYSPLFRFLEHAVAQRFVREEHHRMLVMEESIEDILDRFANEEPVIADKWMDIKSEER
ncbi:TIGR00730 family Rossman fold protein [Luteolibacter sp. SL250]|uniref:LOG family protein n=1 Tax=Luteolibacter sp. SL250 TaxID=2995170 RepID=UPI00226E84AF|nr:TIGR00730 family Rossman fold protein [Luteolibacter sp. SL250]WAC21738.1 TIGR00730 family Rossman fold protein [Luteolibacter sp. SL250]